MKALTALEVVKEIAIRYKNFVLDCGCEIDEEEMKAMEKLDEIIQNITLMAEEDNK